MKSKVDQFSAKNPNPSLHVDKYGTVLNSNDAGKVLLNNWDVEIGGKLPSSIGDFVQRAISRNSPEKMEFKVGKKVYLTVFHPFHEKKCVCISGFDISDQKESEGKAQESKAQEMADVELAETIDVQAIQSLMDEFNKITRIPVGLNYKKGNILVSSGWQEICVNFHRIHPEACKHCKENNMKLITGIFPGETKLYKCKNNMWDIATPIIVSGKHVGYIFLGQFFFDDEPLDYENFKFQARKYSLNEEEYLAALEKVPRLSREVVDTGMTFLTKFANLISQLSYSNSRLAQSLMERDTLMDALLESEKRERARSEELAVVLDAAPAAVLITQDSQALKITGNRLSYEWLQLPKSANLSQAVPVEKRPENYKLFKDGVEIPLADMPLRIAASGKEVHNFEFDIVYSDGTMRHLLGDARTLRDEHDKPRGAVAAFIDITERMHAEQEQEISIAFLRLVNENKGTMDLIHSAVCFFHERSGFEAVGIRLEDGGDYPYCETTGFHEEFATRENILCTRDETGQPARDSDGYPILECMCGNVICGRFDASRSFFTARGSFWTNSTTELLVTMDDDSCQGRTLNRCNGEGYESMALIALRVGKERLGLLQLNDKRKGKLSPRTIALWERLADYLAVAIAKARADEELLAAYKNREELSVKLEFHTEELQAQSEELQKANEALRESEEKYRNIVETADEGIFITSAEAILTYSNKRTAEILGYNKEEIIGRSVWDFINEEAKESAKLHLEKRKHGISESYELKLVRKDGSTLWTLINAKSLFDKNGKFVGSLSMITDITERKQAEKALHESEMRFRALAENSPDVIARFDRQHRHVYANPAAVESYGIPLDKIIGKTQCELGRDPRKAKLWEKCLEFAFTTGKNETLEYHHISIQGKKYYFDAKIVPEYADGEIVSVLAISRDITDIMEAEAKLKETLDNLENLVKERTKELQKAYDLLKESEKGLAEAQKMAHIGNWEWDIATYKARWSEEMYRIFGLSPQDPVPSYEEFLNYSHPEDRDHIRSVLKKAKNQNFYGIDFRILSADGEERTIHMQTKVIFDRKRNPIRIKGTVQDITERKRAEEKIRNLANVVESSSDAIGTISLDGIITSWNKGAELVYGYPAEEILGKSVSIVAPPHMEKETIKLINKIKQGKKIHNFETLRLRKDGKAINVSLTLSPVFDIHRKLTRISVISRDITERKRVEEKLRVSEEKYRNIVETANEGIALVSSEGIITYVNKKMADMVGYAVEEGNGRPIFDFLSEESIDVVKSNMKIRQQGFSNSYESQFIKKDGSLIWVHINAKSLLDKNGRYIGTLVMITDITESKITEITLKEKESRFRNLFEVIASGVAIFNVINHGNDFIFKDMNPAYERIFHLQRENVIGKSFNEILPDASKLGLDATFRWVWLSGQQEFVPLTLYEDKDITAWLTANVFRLPSGELGAVFEDITERKQAYEEREQLLDCIQQEKDRLVALVNSITDEVWFADTQKNFTLVNPAALNEFNIADEGEFKADKSATPLEVYRPDGSLLPEGEAPPLRALQGVIVKNQEEIVHMPGSGELRYRQVSASPVRDTIGNIIGSVSVVRDITENKRAEAALQKSEEQYRTLFNTMTEGFCIVEILFDENEKPIDYIFVEANPAFEKQTGLSNVVGKRIRELSPVYEEYWSGIFDRIALTDESTRFENPVEALHRWYEVYAYRIGQPENRRFAIVFNDITERKRADEALKESEEKYRNIVETASEGINIINDEAKITYVNKKMEDMFGYSVEEFIGRPIWDFISEEFKSTAKLNLERRRQGVNESFEIKFIRKDSLPMWVYINSKSIFDKAGAFIGSMNMLTDMTKRKEAEESLANIEIARKKEIHHRIKNNLQVISSLLDLQAEKFKDRENIIGSEVLEAFKESQSRVISMALIHEELYRGGGFETLDFSAYVEEFAGNLLSTYKLGNADISLNRDLEGDLFLNMDTAVPLGIIINELISNSFKHAFPGRDKGEIRIKLHREGKGNFINISGESKLEDCKRTNLILSVSDNGVGIPENVDIDNLETLGLQLVTSLVQQLDGELEIKRNKGTEFIIRFTVTEKNNKASPPVPINYNQSPKFHH